MAIEEKKFTIGSRGSLISSLVVFVCVISAFLFVSFHASAAPSASFQLEITAVPQCSDGVDNDSDGKTDHPDDPGCDSPSDDNETDTPPSGGGGGGGVWYFPASVIFDGRAFPESEVILLKDGQIVVSTTVGPDATFHITLSNLTSGSYIFSIYGNDSEGRRSSLFTFSISLTAGASTTIGGIFVAPTIDVDKSEVKRGENIGIFGQTVPGGEVTISINSEEEYFIKTSADEFGRYFYSFDTSPLEPGEHLTKSKATLNEETAPFGTAVTFVVGDASIPKSVSSRIMGDLNGDGRVNLVDFSIVAYWYKRPITEEFLQRERDDLNGDGIIDLVDFSILAFYWTG